MPNLNRLSVELLSKAVTIYPIPVSVRAQQIVALFAQCGPVKTVQFQYDESGRQRPQVQVQFFHFETAGYVFKRSQKETYLLSGHPICIWSDLSRRWTKHRFGIPVQGHGTRLFVQNLSPATSEEQLIKYFSQYGAIVDAQLFIRLGISMGKATITFAKEADARRTLQLASQSTLDGKVPVIKLDPTFRSLGDYMLHTPN